MKRDPLSLEAIYYSHPIPRDNAVLTLLGFVFDKVHFTGAYLPKSGYDAKGLESEIERLRQWENDFDTAELIGTLRFLRHVPVLEGFCEFLPDSSSIFGNNRIPEQTIAQIYDAIHGPPREGWIPSINSGSTKALPGGNEVISCRGLYHQLACSVYDSARSGIPLVNDVPGLPVFSEMGSPSHDAQALVGLLSMRCMELILPELPVLAPADLMEFRAENATALKAFRRSMLRYAADLNDKIDGAELGDIEKITQFFVDTEIAPALDELRAASKKPGWKWMNRSINYLKIGPEIGAAYLAAGKMAAIAAAIRGASSQAATDVQTSQGATKLLRKNGLYYLLKVSMTRTAPGRHRHGGN